MTLLQAGTATADDDTTPPVLASVSLSTHSVDISDGGTVTITVTARITDDLSGFQGGNVALVGADGGIPGSWFTRVSGDEFDGVYTATVDVSPEHTGGLPSTGTYFLTVALHDEAGNVAHVTTPEQVVVSTPSNGQGPIVSNVHVQNRTVDVSSGPDTVTVTATITDASGGQFQGACYVTLTYPDSNMRALPGAPCESDLGDPSGNGYIETLPFAPHLPPGDWTATLRVVPGDGSSSLSTTVWLGTIAVTDSDPDQTSPSIDNVVLDPTSIDVSNADAPVAVTADVADPSPSSGIFDFEFDFVSPSGIHHPVVVPAPTAGDTYAGTFWMARYSEPGHWSVILAATDAAGNGAAVWTGSIDVVDSNPGGPGTPAPTVTTLASSPNPSSYGDPVTFTATVSGASPQGAVTFAEGGTNLATVPLTGSDPTAVYTTRALTRGDHTIVARYDGDPNHAASHDGTTQTVGKAGAGAPANDDFADASPLGAGSASFDGSLATVESGEQAPPGPAPGTVWFTIGPGRGALKLHADTNTPSPGALRVTVYTGATIDSRALVLEGDGQPGGPAEVVLPTLAGVTYHIQVAGPTAFSGSPGTFLPGVGAGTLTYEFMPAPANDDFADAAPLGAGPAAFDTSLATVEPDEQAPHVSTAGTVWFTTSPGRGALKLHAETNTPSPGEPRVTVYTGATIGSLALTQSFGGAAEVVVPTVAGATYHVQVTGPAVSFGQPASFTPGVGAGTLTHEFTATPANDDFADAAPLGAGPAAFDTSLATFEAGEQAPAATETVWFTTSPGRGALKLHAATNTPSPGALRVTVYTGATIATLVSVGQGDGQFGGAADVVVPTVAGVTYHVQVAGPAVLWGPGTFMPGIGAGTLTGEYTPAPANDDFADAQTIQPGTIGLPANWWTAATAQPAEPAHAGSAAAHSVWYRIAPVSGRVVLGSPGNRVAVYRGAGLATLTAVASSASGDVTFDTAGGTYLVAIDGGTGTSVAYGFTPGEVASSTATVTTTDSELPPDGATPTDPIETTVTRPIAGTTTIFETQDGPDPSAWRFLGWKVEITAPPSDATHPYQLLFRLDATLLAGSTTPIDVFRNGVQVPNCNAGTTTASPDPCVSSRSAVGDDRLVYVRTSHASEWTFGTARATAGTTAGTLRSSSGADAAFLVASNGKSVSGAFAYGSSSGQLVAVSVTALAIAGKTAWFAGVGLDGRTFLAYVEDNGPGSRDVFKLWIAGVAQTGTGTLATGDLAVLSKP